eukprot:g1216.t1
MKTIVFLVALSLSHAMNSDSWAFLTTKLADIYISEFARHTLSIKEGELFELYMRRKHIDENYKHQVLFQSDADVNKENIAKIIETPDSCDQNSGCLPASFTSVSEDFLQWCSDIRNARYDPSSITTRSNLGQMTSLFVDLHNPLHVAYVGDSGGENCDLSLKSTSNLDDTTLRELWDTEIVETILSPSQFDDETVVNGVVNALHSFIQENIQEIENDGAVNAFEDIFTHETYADMIEVWMMYTHNITRLCYEFDGKSQSSPCESGKTVTVDDEYVDRARHLLQIQIGVAGLRLGSFVNRAATAAMSSEYNQTYSLIWTVILCGIFLSGAIMWAILYPRLKRRFSRARSDSDEYHAFDDNDDNAYGYYLNNNDNDDVYSYFSD